MCLDFRGGAVGRFSVPVAHRLIVLDPIITTREFLAYEIGKRNFVSHFWKRCREVGTEHKQEHIFSTKTPNITHNNVCARFQDANSQSCLPDCVHASVVIRETYEGEKMNEEIDIDQLIFRHYNDLKKPYEVSGGAV